MFMYFLVCVLYMKKSFKYKVKIVLFLGELWVGGFYNLEF